MKAIGLIISEGAFGGYAQSMQRAIGPREIAIGIQDRRPRDAGATETCAREDRFYFARYEGRI